MAQSVLRFAMCWTVRGSNPDGGDIFRTIQTGPEAHLTSSTVGAGGFPGLKRPKLGANPSPPPSFGYKWVGSIASPSCQPRHVMGDLYIYLTLKIKEGGMGGA
jgi:hypothetical protein